MKKIILFILFLMHIVAGKAQWYLLPTDALPPIHDVSFVTENIGFIVTNNVVYKTTDGGYMWDTVLYSPTKQLTKIDFSTANTGFVVGPGYKNIYKTTDQGLIWSNLELPYTCTENFDFIDGKDTIITTCDTIYTYSDVSFSNALTGYIALGYDEDKTYTGDNWGRILKTTDGGTTWTVIVTDNLFPFSSVMTIKNSSTVYTTAYFSDPVFTPNQYVGVSSDGGSTWKNITPGNWANNTAGTNVEVYTTSPNSVFIAQDNLLVEQNYGTNYTYTISNSISVKSIWFINDLVGFTTGIDNVTHQGVTLSTQNGGYSWQLVNLSSSQINQAIYFYNSEIGYMVGENGEVYKTTNGGGLYIVTDVNEISDEKSINVYPNPVIQSLVISTKSLENTKIEIQIINTLGQIVFTNYYRLATNYSINLSHLQSGLYYLRIGNDVKKFIKE